MPAIRKNPPNKAAATIQDLASKGHAIIGIAKALGVGRATFKRWCEEDDTLQEALEMGRETERLYLHSLIVQAAALNKGANVNAFFILKARHGYRENDPQNIQVEVKQPQSVMYVINHGSDEEWAARCAAQQREVTLNVQSPRAATVSELQAPVEAVQDAPTYPTPSQSDYAPAWHAKS